ncbi:MAG: CDP-glucose 4,6-dehydratase [Acidobacteriia bacterium]|nr:CDP-glucose 4,6-dehydratase [Terriglobia bacterium]
MFWNRYRGKKVFVTGHTGFKGSWLSEWLIALGAEVTGFSDIVKPEPSLFRALRLESRIHHVIGDVRDFSAVAAAIRASEPDFVFHLAAQPIVRLSYLRPAETFHTNVLGTVHVLETIRALPRPPAAVFITSDKCYENREWVDSYREEDHMGGHDPYSASKGSAELAIHSWRRSFFQTPGAPRIASARAGNVIGGGDWSEYRILPDCIRALLQDKEIIVRSPEAIRPWQHVLEPLSGYLLLGATLANGASLPAHAYNFGPEIYSNRNVRAVVTEVLKHWPGKWKEEREPSAPHESYLLNLAIDKAVHYLKWRPVWSFERAIEATTNWYRCVEYRHADAGGYTRADVERYCADAQKLGVLWAQS